MPATISAADHLRRSACPPDTYRQAGDLLLALATVECHVTAAGPVGVPPALLRDLVIIAARLAGRSWLDANPGKTATFTVLSANERPSPLPELDQILANVLSARFGLAPPAGQQPEAPSSPLPWQRAGPEEQVEVSSLTGPDAGGDAR